MSAIAPIVWKSLVGEIPTPEHKFHKSRKWRIDYAFAGQKLAVEIEGGVWSRGRHTRGSGFVGDMEKYNALTEDGWYLLRYQPHKIDFDQIKRIIHNIDMYGNRF